MPRWIVTVLAGTYWRIFGHPQNGMDCFKWALASVPRRYEDVVLTTMAGLLYKSGSLEDALVLMKDALKVNDKDPDANFFMANLLSATGNFSGALHFYQQSLRMRPDFAPAKQFILVSS